MTGLAAASRVWAASATRDADLVLLNGNIHTVDVNLSSAEAIAVNDGRFVAVGSTEEAKAAAGSGRDVSTQGE